MPKPSQPATIDEYVATFPPNVQRVLKKIRSTVRAAAPDAEERISYRMPAFFQNGILIYFAAFQNHIGVYPPLRGDSELIKATERYRGEKGNLRLPLDEPMPYELIARIVKLRVRQNAEKRAVGKEKGAPRKTPKRGAQKD
jgi:uncharacterized protein YdhG (YjbR/CyaY superfamily)